MVESLMRDKHFNNSKLNFNCLYLYNLVLGDLLNKRPVAKKVEGFMARQV
jgi:hypothetical protein